MNIEVSNTLPQRDYLSMKLVVVEQQRLPLSGILRVVFRLQLRNISTGGIRLLGRKWIISDSAGHLRIIEAEDVFNQQPLLAPGAVFSHSGAHEFKEAPPTSMELRIFGADVLGDPFMTPPLVFPQRLFRR